MRIVEARAGLVISVLQERLDLARIRHSRLLIEDALYVLLHQVLLLVSCLLGDLVNVLWPLILLDRCAQHWFQFRFLLGDFVS